MREKLGVYNAFLLLPFDNNMLTALAQSTRGQMTLVMLRLLEEYKIVAEGVGYIDIDYPGQHIRDTHDKSDTFTVEGVNADLRHYIPILARRVDVLREHLKH